MISDSDKLNVLLHEREILRNENIEIGKATRYAIYAFVMVAISFIGLYLNEQIFPDLTLRSYVLLGLSQLEVFVAFSVLSLWTNMRIRSGYVAAIEGKLNKLSGEKLTIYESEIFKIFYLSPRKSFVYISAILALFSLALFIILFVISFQEFNQFWYGILIAIEAIALVLFLVLSNIEQSKAMNYANDEIGKAA